MARLPRYFAEGVPQHIILRGNNREAIFANDEDCQFFKEVLFDAARRHGLSIHAYGIFGDRPRLPEMNRTKITCLKVGAGDTAIVCRVK